MAVRLPLIVSQPFRRDAAAIDLMESIVAAAILVPGLDANLVGDIEVMESGSTDYLCLEGHGRNLVLASFLDMPTAESAWQRLSLGGRFVDFSASEDALRLALKSPSPGRVVYYFQLLSDSSVTTLLDKCHKLLAAQQLSLVSIQLAPSTAPTGNRQGSEAVSAKSLPIMKSDARNAAEMRAPVLPILSGSPPIGQFQPEEEDDEQWTELDKLVDDLGTMDL